MKREKFWLFVKNAKKGKEEVLRIFFGSFEEFWGIFFTGFLPV
jgi:hypothetical protein